MHKIVFYISSIGDGGAQRVVANLVNYFSNAYYDVILVTEKPRANEYFIVESIKRIYLENEEPTDSRLKRNLKWVKKLHHICKEERAEVLVSFMAEPNYRSVAATIGTKTKSIISVRNDPNYEYSGIIGRLLGKILLPMADGCVFQTNDARKWFPEKLQKKSVIIRNSVNHVFFSRKWRPTKSKAVAIGRLNKQKNYYVMMKAIKIVHDQGYNISLSIFGVGDEEQNLQKFINENSLNELIVLKGRTNNVAGELEKANMFLMSSDYEGMPNALMEAMAIGVPSISTDCPCGGPKDLLSDECGILVGVGNSQQLAREIIRVLTDNNLADTLSQRAKIKAESFRPETINKEWETYIASVCNGLVGDKNV